MSFSLPERSILRGPNYIRDVFERGAHIEGFISFGIGNPAAEAIPVEVIQQMFDEVVHNEPINILQYGPMNGDMDLRELTWERLEKVQHISKDGQEMLISIGAGQDLGLVARTICEVGDEVYMDGYTFTNGINAVRHAGAHAIGIPMDELGMIPEELDKAAQSGKGKYIYLIPNFQNPTGITMPIERRKAIYEVARKHNLFIYEDDPYGEIRFAGERVQAFKEFDVDNRVIYAGSYSKTLAAGLRVGFLVGPTEVIQALQVVKNNCDGQMPLVTQRVVAKLLQQINYDDQIKKVCSIYREKRVAMVDTFKATASSKVTITEPEGGMFLWMTLPDDVNVNEFFEAAMDAKVGIVTSGAFAADNMPVGQHFRLCYTVPTVEDIKKGMTIIGELTKQFCGE